MSFELKYNITPRYLTPVTRRRPGLSVSPSVKFIVAHDTGNPGSSAGANVKYYQNTENEISASAHIFVDDKEILECIPALTGPPEKAWHVRYSVPHDNRLYGFDANDAAIGVEYCFGGSVNADEAYRKYVWVLAYLCYKFNLDPATSIVGHFFLDPERRTDPNTGLGYSRRTYDQLLSDIVLEYQRCTGQFTAPTYDYHAEEGKAKVVYRLNVRKGEPTTSAVIAQVVGVDTILDYVGWVSDGEKVNGNSKWYKLANGNYFWSGGVVEEKDISDRLLDIAEAAVIGAAGILWGIARLKVDELHKQGINGKSVRVAILDSGIDLKHPDLKNAVSNAIDSSESPTSTSDVIGHGTHIAGIVSARKVLTNFKGVAPESELDVYKVRNDMIGFQDPFFVKALKQAMQKADIINMSLHFYNVSETFREVIRAAYAEDKILVAASEISTGGELSYPAHMSECISVGSVMLTGNKIVVDPASIPYMNKVDVVAPGYEVLSTIPNSAYKTMSGSSMAAAFVTGVLSLALGELKKDGRSITPNKLKAIILETNEDVFDVFGNKYPSKMINPAALISKIKTIV